MYITFIWHAKSWSESFQWRHNGCLLVFHLTASRNVKLFLTLGKQSRLIFEESKQMGNMIIVQQNKWNDGGSCFRHMIRRERNRLEQRANRVSSGEIRAWSGAGLKVWQDGRGRTIMQAPHKFYAFLQTNNSKYLITTAAICHLLILILLLLLF